MDAWRRVLGTRVIPVDEAANNEIVAPFSMEGRETDQWHRPPLVVEESGDL